MNRCVIQVMNSPGFSASVYYSKWRAKKGRPGNEAWGVLVISMESLLACLPACLPAIVQMLAALLWTWRKVQYWQLIGIP